MVEVAVIKQRLTHLGEHDRVVVDELLGKLATERDDLTAERDEYKHERDEYKKLYALLLEQCEKLKRGLLGQKAEKLPKNDAQLTLSILELLLGNNIESDGADDAAEKTTVEPHERKKPTGRKPLPAHLPRVEIELLPLEVQAKGLDNFARIGEETSEVIERRPASTVVVRTVRPKFVEKSRGDTEKTIVHVAEPLDLPIERGLAGPGMLADTIVKRWQDHLPLYRQESIFAREGLELARSTICAWHMELADLCEPIIEAMHADALTQPYLCTDATGVLVQAKEKCKHGHFWVLVAPERHVLFKFSSRHDGDAVDKLLDGYDGYIVADAHAVYNHLYVENGGSAIEVACWAHCRRYFFKSLSSDPERAKSALAKISVLFRIERTNATAPRKKKEKVRAQKSRPIVDQFFDWCDAESLSVLDDSPIAKAIGYARNQRTALQRFLDDGRLPMHNNISEGALRRQAVGRKNWLFLGSEDGAHANTVFVSLLASCQMHGIEPWAYLRDLFCLLPSWPKRRALELAPLNWQETLKQPETQQALAANPFRAVVLGAGDHVRISTP